MQTEHQRPIIIKKVKKGGHGHHGGAWKIAYADFVTAMMAFFLLMWLLGSTSKEDLQGIAQYFQNPLMVSLSGGSSTGDRTSIIPGGGQDLTRVDGQVKKAEVVDPEEAKKRLREQEAKRMQETKEKLEKMIEQDNVLKEFKNQLKIDITPEGLRIQIVDQDKRPMFDLASARMAPYAEAILRKVAPIVNELPNKITVLGHTDSRPFGSGRGDYSNWELSADRANAARRMLNASGIAEGKVMRVSGLADSVPFNPGDPADPINRRISIILLKKEVEEQYVANTGAVVPPADAGAASPSQDH
ncbi:flagellar motor protein MotB [Thiofaba sp. EF100]|jgi:chemotaxis protein MotB|uniref:flagellar motor protein MotB n=1 Tax=Thiofaba sp. EF100 TaxID=3121274 RepID=UPI00322192AE